MGDLSKDFLLTAIAWICLHAIKMKPIYEYITDNTLSFHAPNFDEVVNVLQQESNILINWFHFNCMQANPSDCS
jgi:hypothetical protein